MSNEEMQPQANARPARTIRLKIAAWAIVVLIAALLISWSVKSMLCDAALRDRAEDSARGIASAIAAFGNRDVVSRSYKDLQRYSDDLVRDRRIAFVAIADMRGRVVVHTDRGLLGKQIDELPKPSGVVDARSRVMDVTRQAGTVVVGVRTK
jgi:sensor histidine kinase regulating citrate/malate metabolism